MPSATAGRLCPRGVFVRPRMDRYKEESGFILRIMGETGAVIEPMSIVPLKSISGEETFLQDTEDRGVLRACLWEQAADIAAKLKRRHLAAHTIQVKVRYGDFTTLTRQLTVEEPITEAKEFRALADAPVVTKKAVVQVQTKTRLHINADTANEVDDLYAIIMDIQAIEVVLNANDLETHIMPVNVASALVFDLDEVRVKLAGRNDLLGLLCRRWQDHVDGSRRQRAIWDLSVISCLVHPEFGEEISAQTPPENTAREVRVYSKIDGRRIRDEFFAAVAEHCGPELREAQAGTRDGGARGN